MRRQRGLTWVAAAGLLMAVAGCADESGPSLDADQTEGAQGPDDRPQDGDAEPDGPDPAAAGTFHDADGQQLGSVELIEAVDATEVRVQIDGLPPGFFGLHVHEIGECEPGSADPEDPEETGDFLSAGAHLNPDGVDHGDHAGDLPPLLVTDDGQAIVTVLTDRFTPADLLDGDGAAFMVHSEADNFANIPQRYGDMDSDTLDTGDAGDRLACAVVE